MDIMASGWSAIANFADKALKAVAVPPPESSHSSPVAVREHACCRVCQIYIERLV